MMADCGATVVNIRDGREGVMYIGRAGYRLKGSIFANPYRLDRFESREACLAAFEAHLRATEMIDQLHLIDGQKLACWCSPESCHGDILIKVRNEQLEGK